MSEHIGTYEVVVETFDNLDGCSGFVQFKFRPLIYKHDSKVSEVWGFRYPTVKILYIKFVIIVFTTAQSLPQTLKMTGFIH